MKSLIGNLSLILIARATPKLKLCGYGGAHTSTVTIAYSSKLHYKPQVGSIVAWEHVWKIAASLKNRNHIDLVVCLQVERALMMRTLVPFSMSRGENSVLMTLVHLVSFSHWLFSTTKTKDSTHNCQENKYTFLTKIAFTLFFLLDNCIGIRNT